ncbi:uncharacterized protein LOC101860459 [Aplysia californica]|uniref:Uncharacterized protein LOC101860459 n=1 Tax=Aplysia californica TaxID=6500 RepID=A0ABM0K8M5_APLCA|nr:uncharacterized protein LOC101860459 [Aplysia californica]
MASRPSLPSGLWAWFLVSLLAPSCRPVSQFPWGSTVYIRCGVDVDWGEPRHVTHMHALRLDYTPARGRGGAWRGLAALTFDPSGLESERQDFTSGSDWSVYFHTGPRTEMNNPYRTSIVLYIFRVRTHHAGSVRCTINYATINSPKGRIRREKFFNFTVLAPALSKLPTVARLDEDFHPKVREVFEGTSPIQLPCPRLKGHDTVTLTRLVDPREVEARGQVLSHVDSTGKLHTVETDAHVDVSWDREAQSLETNLRPFSCARDTGVYLCHPGNTSYLLVGKERLHSPELKVKARVDSRHWVLKFCAKGPLLVSYEWSVTSSNCSRKWAERGGKREETMALFGVVGHSRECPVYQYCAQFILRADLDLQACEFTANLSAIIDLNGMLLYRAASSPSPDDMVEVYSDRVIATVSPGDLRLIKSRLMKSKKPGLDLGYFRLPQSGTPPSPHASLSPAPPEMSVLKGRHTEDDDEEWSLTPIMIAALVLIVLVILTSLVVLACLCRVYMQTNKTLKEQQPRYEQASREKSRNDKPDRKEKEEDESKTYM